MTSADLHYDTEQLDALVADIQRRFPNDIEHVRYTLDEDWTRDPALFVRVLLKDKPGAIYRLDDPRSQVVFSLCNSIMTSIRAALRSVPLQPYFYFRWVSEQAILPDPLWD